jgi:two-component system chemotaxis sensor kinase CheA
VTVEDDGRGLDPERVRARAISLGLIKPEAQLSPAEASDLVFWLGFSTKAEVGELSGRGVGLDIVRRDVLDLGGAVRVESTPGRGARFSLHVPLTLAALEGLVIRCGGERLVVPIDRVKTLVRPRPGQIAHIPEGREILRMPDENVPLVRPGALFGARAHAEKAEAVAVVVETAAGPIALHAEEVISQESVMLKPLQRSLRVGGEGVLGAAVLGDGGVALILDVARLAAWGPRGAAREENVSCRT